MEAQPGMAPLPKLGFSIGRYWPIGVMVLLMVLVWVPVFVLRSQAGNLARVIEEKRQQSVTINALNEELNNLRQQNPQRAGKKLLLIPVPEPSDGVKVTGEKAIPTGNPNLKYGLEITIEAEKEIQPLGLTLQFTGEVDKSSNAKFPMKTYTGANDPNDIKLFSRPDMVGVQWESPAWEPHEPIVFRIFSVNKIALKRVIPGLAIKRD